MFVSSHAYENKTHYKEFVMFMSLILLKFRVLCKQWISSWPIHTYRTLFFVLVSRVRLHNVAAYQSKTLVKLLKNYYASYFDFTYKSLEYLFVFHAHWFVYIFDPFICENYTYDCFIFHYLVSMLPKIREEGIQG